MGATPLQEGSGRPPQGCGRVGGAGDPSGAFGGFRCGEDKVIHVGLSKTARCLVAPIGGEGPGGGGGPWVKGYSWFLYPRCRMQTGGC